MKQLAVIAVSALLYFRKVFPENAFKCINYNSTFVWLFHPILCCENEFIVHTVCVLHEFIYLLEKNLENELVLEISTETFETYRLKFSQNKRNKSVMTFLM
jgi:hypothetical protein